MWPLCPRRGSRAGKPALSGFPLRRPQARDDLRPELLIVPRVPTVDFLRPNLESTVGQQRIVNRPTDDPHRRILPKPLTILVRIERNDGQAVAQIQDEQDRLLRADPMASRHSS